ncbi:caspase family protein [Leptolyngbya sp. UWPOB_LEPTO1]|uniref:HTH domain-containing protein n=1 Tax=Leptolyngbya sp. UWPOB_LEPTO1 TaxID=2815653 RepID=UPI002579E368|nr:caspase family protein [Leptolyngbya sp. UWPOB_LEPTO1]
MSNFPENDEPRRYLIVIGSPHCPNLGLSHLPGVESDLAKVLALFANRQQGYQSALVDVIPIGATSSEIKNALSNWFSSPDRRASDCVILYYAGHGDEGGRFGDHYLFTVESRENSLANTAIATRSLIESLFQGDNDYPQNVLLILDVCYGAIGQQQAFDTLNRLKNCNSTESGVWIIATSTDTQAGDGAFVEAFALAMQVETGSTEEFLSIDQLIQKINQHFKETQQVQRATLSGARIQKTAPFIRNPRFQSPLQRIQQPTLLSSIESRGIDFTIGILTSKVEQLSSELSKTKARQLEEYRELYRQGKFQEASSILNTLRADEHWNVFDKALQAQILQSLAGYALGVEQNVTKAQELANQAQALEPGSETSIIQVLIQYHLEGAEAALALLENPSTLDLCNLKLGLYLELGQLSEVFSQLEALAQVFEANSETHRIHALALLDQGDISGAQVKIQQARYDNPKWEKIRAAEATINYFSALSPSVVPRLIDRPLPVEWCLVKRDDESLRRLRMAAADFSQLAAETERGDPQRDYWEIWHLAALANDPEYQAEAQTLCQTLLAKDPTHPQAIAWGMVRRYEIDTASSQQALEALIQAGSQDLERMITLLGLYIQFNSPQLALDLLKVKQDVFERTNHSELWQFWYVQALSANSDFEQALEIIATFSRPEVRRNLQTAVFYERARLQNDWQPLAEFLEICWQESANYQYLYEACQLQAKLKNWRYIAERADVLVESIATADALSLAAFAAWQVDRAEQCYQLLNHYLHLFPHRVLPPDLRRLKTQCQARLGLLPQAIADASELVSLQETAENLAVILNLQIDHGDLQGIAQTATRLLRNEKVSPGVLLRAARCLLIEDFHLARRLWQRAVVGDIDNNLLREVITLGYNLGLDRELRPFIHRAQTLALTGQGPFQIVSVSELLKREQESIASAEAMNSQYDAAEIPIHLIAQSRNISLSGIFHSLLNANASEPNPLFQAPIFIRHGARLFPKITLESTLQRRLHLDISALLVAAHLGILDVLERRFHPIRISPALPTALLQESEYFTIQQPSQLASCREILRLHKAKQLQQLPSSLTLDSESLLEHLNKQTAILLQQARRENGFVVEFLPLERFDEDETFQPIVLEGSDQQRLINCRAVIEVLREEGSLSQAAYDSAVENLPDLSRVPVSQRPIRNDALFVNSELIRSLAGSDLLAKLCRHFRVFVVGQCIDEAQAAVDGNEAATEMVQWIRELMQRISDGLVQGQYEMISVLSHHADEASEARQSWGASGLTAHDLLNYQPQENDLLWIDDRFFNQYPYQEHGVPIIGILEILEMLRVHQDLSEAEYYEKILQLRKSNARYVPITSQEILYHLKQAQVKDNGKLQETEDLAILRRYMAACLLDSHRLQRPSEAQNVIHSDGEFPFVSGFVRATLETLSAIWADEQRSIKTAAAYSDWILFNLYTGMFGVRHLLPEPDIDQDGLEVLSDDIRMLYCRGLGLWRIDEQNRHFVSHRRRAYFDWLERRVIERRFRANPEMIPAIARLICETILHLSRDESLNEQQSYLYRLMLERFYRDLPVALRNELNAEPELATYFQIEIIEAVNLGQFDPDHCPIFSASEFLNAISTVMNGQEAELKASNSELTYRVQAVHPSDTVTQLHFTNLKTAHTFAVRDDVMGLASANPKMRERLLRENSAWFDCDRTTYENAVVAIVSTIDLQSRFDQANQWRRESARCFYEAFQQKIYQDQEFTIEELIPTSGAGLLRHFHLAQQLPKSSSFSEGLESAAISMLAVNDLETCLERFSCFPTKLPSQLKEAFLSLPFDEREQLLKRLVDKLTSPVCQLHLLNLAVSSPGLISLAQQIFNALLSKDGQLQFQLFQTILHLVDKEFSYWLEARQWSPSIRLAITWAHSSKLHNLLYEPDVDVEAFIRGLNELNQISQISAEILDRDAEVWNDMLSPRRLNQVRFIVGGMTALFQDCEQSVLEAIGVAQALTSFATKMVEDQRFLSVSLWHDDNALAQDNLGVLWGKSHQRDLALILGEDLAKQRSSDYLKAVVETAIEALETEPTSENQWSLLICIVGDLPIYADCAEKLSQLAQKINFVKLYEAQSTKAFLVLRVVCDHAANTADEELRAKLEAELIAIAKSASIQTQSLQTDKEISEQLLECALKVTVKPNSPRMTSASLNMLLEKIATAWWQFSKVHAEGMCLTSLNLPANQLHQSWTTNLKLRALRRY